MTRRFAAALVAVTLLAVPACGGDEPEEEATHPLLDDSPPADESTPTMTATAAASTPEPTETGFPEECGQVIDTIDVANIVAAPMPGVRRIYQDDFPADSGRLERLTCSYGTETAESEGDEDDNDNLREQPVVEIAVSDYVDAASASARVEDTVGSARLRGDDVEEAEIGGHQVFVIPGNDATSYVLSDQERTYVVTLARDVVPEPAEEVVFTDLVTEILGTPSES